MAEDKAPHVTPPHVVHKIHPPPREPGPATRRAAVEATRSTSTVPAPHPATYAPWANLLKAADSRYKTEITAAIRELETTAATAGQILDSQYATATEAATALESAAWAQWRKLMAAADDTRNAILKAATAAYDQAIDYGHAQYALALADAERTYKLILEDANRAKADAAAIVA